VSGRRRRRVPWVVVLFARRRAAAWGTPTWQVLIGVGVLCVMAAGIIMRLTDKCAARPNIGCTGNL
jgi:hypothetical protein